MQKSFHNKKLILGLVVVVIILVIVGVRVWQGNQNKTVVQTTKVEKGTLVSTVSASGQILTANLVNINTSAKGLIKKVYVKDGEQVKQGQKLVEFILDSEGQQKSTAAYSSYLSAKNALESARAAIYTSDSGMWAANQKFLNDAIVRDLSTADPTYIQQHDDWLAAEAKYKNQQTVLDQVRIAVNNAWLTYQAVAPIVLAPTDGEVNNLVAVEGIVTSGESTRMAIIKTLGLHIATFNVSEIDVVKIKPGQKATLKLDSLSDKTFVGKVMSVDRLGVVASNVTNYPVIIQLESTAEDILPNMSVTANIILETKSDVLLVPNSAIQTQSGQAVVRIKKNSQEQTVVVETGLTSVTQTEIVSGLNEGDEVITSPSTTSGSTSSTSRTSVFGTFGGSGTRGFVGR